MRQYRVEDGIEEGRLRVEARLRVELEGLGVASEGEGVHGVQQVEQEAVGLEGGPVGLLEAGEGFDE